MTDGNADPSNTDQSHAPPERPSTVQVEAAKLRLVTDKRLGKQTPEWVTRVAQGLPAINIRTAG